MQDGQAPLLHFSVHFLHLKELNCLPDILKTAGMTIVLLPPSPAVLLSINVPAAVSLNSLPMISEEEY